MKRKNSLININLQPNNKTSLQKLQTKLSSLPVGKASQPIIPSIESTTKNIFTNIEGKVNHNFANILAPQTMMPISTVKAMNNQFKENSKIIEGKKALIYTLSDKLENKSVSMIPTSPINQKQNITPAKSGNLKTNQRVGPSFVQSVSLQDEHAKYMKKQQQLKAFFYRYVIGMVDYQLENDSVEYLQFQKINYKIWDDIQEVISAMQKLCKHYEITLAMIELKKIPELIAANDKKKPQKQFSHISQKYHIHDLLGCFQDNEDIGKRSKKKKGIRFYGNKGKHNAIIKIQSSIRRYLCKKKFNKIKEIVQKIIIIQRFVRLRKQYKLAKKQIVKNQIKILDEFNKMQKQFKASYREKELIQEIKYEIHISSHCNSQWQRISTPKFIELQNTQISRIFRIVKDLSLIETRVIYISPVPITHQIMSYYYKLLKLGNVPEPQQKIFILCPQVCSEDFLIKCSLLKCLLYSSHTLKRIKKIIGNDYSYIVPSTPSSQYINLCHYMKIPLYSSNPQPLLYLQSKSGFKRTVSKIMKQSLQEIRTNILPMSLNIYSQQSFVVQLTKLICKHPQVKKWILSIEDQSNSRGLAYFITDRIIPNSLLQSLKQENPEKSSSQILKIQNHLQEVFFKNDRNCICLVNEKLYQTQRQYFQNFFSRGGVIQAFIEHRNQELEHLCFCIEIQPDSNWKFVCNYKKVIVNKNCVGSFFPKQALEPPLLIQEIAKYFISKNYFGFFNLQFLQVSKTKSIEPELYLHGIKCNLDQYSSACFLRNFMDKQNTALYIPLIEHPSIKQIRLASFFQLCRLQNISFDIGRKIGNVFMFVDGLECGCLGMMTFSNGNTKNQSFELASQVLDFFSSKISCKGGKKLPFSFLQIRNAVNGFLKSAERKTKSKKISARESLKNI